MENIVIIRSPDRLQSHWHRDRLPQRICFATNFVLWSLLSLSVGIEMVDDGCSLDSVENVMVDHVELQLILYWSRNRRTCSILQNGKHDREGHPWNQLENAMENHNRIRYLHHQVQDNLDRHVLSSRERSMQRSIPTEMKGERCVCNRHVLSLPSPVLSRSNSNQLRYWREKENRCEHTFFGELPSKLYVDWV